MSEIHYSCYGYTDCNVCSYYFVPSLNRASGRHLASKSQITSFCVRPLRLFRSFRQGNLSFLRLWNVLDSPDVPRWGSDYVRRNDRLSIIPHCCSISRRLTHKTQEHHERPWAATTSLNLILSLLWTLLWSNNKTHGNTWWLTVCLSPARPAAHAAGCGAAGLDRSGSGAQYTGTRTRIWHRTSSSSLLDPAVLERVRVHRWWPHRAEDFTATLVEEAGREKTAGEACWRPSVRAACVCVCVCVCVCGGSTGY